MITFSDIEHQVQNSDNFTLNEGASLAEEENQEAEQQEEVAMVAKLDEVDNVAKMTKMDEVAKVAMVVPMEEGGVAKLEKQN